MTNRYMFSEYETYNSIMIRKHKQVGERVRIAGYSGVWEIQWIEDNGLFHLAPIGMSNTTVTAREWQLSRL